MRFPFLSLFLASVCLPVLPQAGQGKPITEIFADFHYFTRGDSGCNNGFGLNRALLGYMYQPVGSISATVIMNIGSPEDLSAGSRERRYAHFREVSITWTNEKLSMAFGMTKTRSLIYQQQFYGKRYVADNFEAINGYSTVADLGLCADYTINKTFKVDFTLMNGEGYNNLHVDNSLKASAGINITPSEKAHLRFYMDVDRPSGVWQKLFIGFAGYKGDVVMIGGEAAYKTNVDRSYGHDSWGLSATGSVKTSPKTELFGRYDYTTSNIKDVENLYWSYLNNRQFAVFGLQYTFNEFARLALNYQGKYPEDKGIAATDAIFINAHFRF